MSVLLGCLVNRNALPHIGTDEPPKIKPVAPKHHGFYFSCLLERKLGGLRADDGECPGIVGADTNEVAAVGAAIVYLVTCTQCVLDASEEHDALGHCRKTRFLFLLRSVRTTGRPQQIVLFRISVVVWGIQEKRLLALLAQVKGWYMRGRRAILSLGVNWTFSRGGAVLDDPGRHRFVALV